MFRRSLQTTATVSRGIVFPKLKNEVELAVYLNKANGNVHDLVPGPTSIVNSEVVRKMLRLSGLESDTTPETEQKWIDALNSQIGFINHLQPPEGQRNTGNMKGEVFRLIPSDHQPCEGLDLEQLMQQVHANRQQANDEELVSFGTVVNSNVNV